MEMGVAGRRGQVFPAPEPEIAKAVGKPADLVPASMRRKSAPKLPELTEPEVQRHYLKLSQQTLGMINISLFGTCTMKYNARVSEEAARKLNDVHPLQHEDTLQGMLAIVHGFDLILRELSGMDQFVFQAGGGADAAYTNAVVMREYFRARGELARAQRNHHLDPGASVQCGDGGGGRLQGGHADAGGERLSVDRGAEGSGRAAHRRALHQQSRRHGHLQSQHQGMGARSSTRRVALRSTITPTSTA